MIAPELGIVGLGYEAIEAVISGEIATILTPIALGQAKIATTSLTLGSGGCGGIFAPTLYIGCMIGIGLIIQEALPTIVTQYEVYPVNEMAAMLAGALQAPLTVIILLTEITKYYELLPPLLIVSPISYFTTWLLLKGSSIYTLKLEKRGLNIKLLSPPIFTTLRACDVMRRSMVTIRADTPIPLLEVALIGVEHETIPVTVDGRRIKGVISTRKLMHEIRLCKNINTKAG